MTAAWLCRTCVVQAGQGRLGRLVGQVRRLRDSGRNRGAHAAVAVVLAGVDGLAEAGDALATDGVGGRGFCRTRGRNKQRSLNVSQWCHFFFFGCSKMQLLVDDLKPLHEKVSPDEDGRSRGGSVMVGAVAPSTD